MTRFCAYHELQVVADVMLMSSTLKTLAMSVSKLGLPSVEHWLLRNQLHESLVSCSLPLCFTPKSLLLNTAAYLVDCLCFTLEVLFS